MPALDLAIRTLSAPALRAIARPLMKRRASVFMLHREQCDATGISGHALDELRRSVRALRASGANLVSVRELVAHARQHGCFPPDAVAFTIDDGFADQGKLARALRDEGVTPTIFLITGFLDGELWPWDDRIALALRNLPASLQVARVALPGGEWAHTVAGPDERKRAARSLQDWLKLRPHDDIEALLQAIFDQWGVTVPRSPPPAYAPLAWDDVRGLERQGVDFAPHSVTHRIFARLGSEDARFELVESRRRLQAELERPLDVFAWPTGRDADFTQRDLRLARELGFHAAFATCDDYAVLPPPPLPDADALYALGRYSLPHAERALLQYGSWIERAKQVARRTPPRVR